jgi:hypothetical protein
MEKCPLPTIDTGSNRRRRAGSKSPGLWEKPDKPLKGHGMFDRIGLFINLVFNVSRGE